MHRSTPAPLPPPRVLGSPGKHKGIPKSWCCAGPVQEEAAGTGRVTLQLLLLEKVAL